MSNFHSLAIILVTPVTKLTGKIITLLKRRVWARNRCSQMIRDVFNAKAYVCFLLSTSHDHFVNVNLVCGSLDFLTLFREKCLRMKSTAQCHCWTHLKCTYTMQFRQYCIDHLNRVKYLFPNSSLVGIKTERNDGQNYKYFIHYISNLPTKYDPIILQCK